MSKIIGVTVGTTTPRPNWTEENERSSAYIKNKPIIDPTLTTEGAIADAKAIGDVINNLSDDLRSAIENKILVQAEPPTDTSAIWIDTNDNTVDDVEGSSVGVTATSIENALGYIPADPSSIPTKNSQLTNDENFVKQKDIEDYAQPKGNYALKSEVPTVPTKVSAFENDKQYATKSELPTAMSQLDNDLGYVLLDDLSAYIPADASYKYIVIETNQHSMNATFEELVQCYNNGQIIIASLETTDDNITFYRGNILLTPDREIADNYTTFSGSLIDVFKDKWDVLVDSSSVEVFSDPVMPAIRYDVEQNLTDEQKEQARENMGVDIPTKISAFENDANYAKKSELPSVPVQSVNGKTGAVQLTASDVSARPSTWIPSAQEVGAEASGAINTHNTNTEAHNDIRLAIKEVSDDLKAFLDVTDEEFDQLSEVIELIQGNSSLIEGIITGKVNVDDIIDNLTTDVTNKPLSAAQGKVLKGLIDKIIIPTTLPNPNALTFTGAVTGTYDGSSAKTINIPTIAGNDGIGITSITITEV